MLGPPVTSPDITDEECGIIRELMSKGVYARICFSTTDLLRVFTRLEANRAVEVIQEPIHHSFGEYDGVLLDPAWQRGPHRPGAQVSN